MSKFICLFVIGLGIVAHADQVTTTCHSGMQYITIHGEPAKVMFKQMKVVGFDNGAAVIKQSEEIESVSCTKAYKYAKSYSCNIELDSSECEDE
jgi:hypothetical protein